MSNGASFNQVTDTVYTGSFIDTMTILESKGIDGVGTGSLLDLQSLTQLTLTQTAGSTRTLTVHAADGGTIDLRNVTTAGMLGNHSGDRLAFLVEGGVNGNGNIRLDSLQSGSQLKFDVRVPNFQLPLLPSLDNSDIIIASGGSIAAPVLTAVTNSTVTLTGSGALQVGPPSGGLSNVNGTRFFMSNGASFNQVTDTVYTGSFIDTMTIFESKGIDGVGTGSLLDLQSLTQLALTQTAGSARTLTVHAADGGTIDLRNVTTAGMLGNHSGDRLAFLVEGGVNGNGNIRLDSLQTGSQLKFDVRAGGVATMGDFVADGRVNITVVGPTFPSPAGILQSNGSLVLDATSTLVLQGGGQLRVAGNLSFATQTESNFSTEAGLVQMNGSGVQLLEVGGEDLGVNGATAGNFGIGQLSAGTPAQPTKVVLLDGVNNGNHGVGGAHEALYLFGINGQDGLNIELNSVVVLYGIQAYAFESSSGQQTHLNSLFSPGVNQVAYDQGFLQLVDFIDGDYNHNGFVDAADYVVWRKLLGQVGAGLPADGNHDNMITTDDYDVWRANFGASVYDFVLPGVGAGQSVPEPATSVMITFVATFVAFLRRPSTVSDQNSRTKMA